jgi:hypothetical protein
MNEDEANRKNPYAAPAAEITAPAPDPYANIQAQLRGDTRGKRVAGVVLLVNAALVLLASFIPKAGGRPISAVIDIVVAVTLLRGYGSAAGIALFRVGLGICFSIFLAIGGDWDPLIGTVPLAVALVLLLVRNPGTARIVVGCVVFGLYVLLAVAGMVAVMTGVAPA